MNPGLQAFLTVALPTMVTLVATIWISSWSQNKRFDDLKKRFDDLRSDINRRLDEIATRLGRIELKLEERIVRVEERTALIHR